MGAAKPGTGALRILGGVKPVKRDQLTGLFLYRFDIQTKNELLNLSASCKKALYIKIYIEVLLLYFYSYVLMS